MTKTEPRPFTITRQLALPPVRDPDRATDLLADLLHDHPHVTDPGVAATLTTGQLDVHLTVHAHDEESAGQRADEILRDALVDAVMAAAAEAIRDERTYWPIGYEQFAYDDSPEDAAAVWAKFDAAEAAGTLVYSAPPDEGSHEALAASETAGDGPR